ncbi:hypothetical protein BGZ96_003774 [Linnemannia gamsii]|uniref:Uncharacterized protein n=1 Tax=Linnemannia gamsii TaxID=64522 RepID=A0ABQ7JIV4_9FUNG|nr:hypothetical protein BGZ96_003774 [Linnemannia gamsii]
MLVKDCDPGTCSRNAYTASSVDDPGVYGGPEFRPLSDDKCLDLCACKESNVSVCASAFDQSCNYGSKSLMACGNEGEVPTVKEECSVSCTKQLGPDVCTFDPCACTKTGDAGGSTLPPNCGYEKDSVYTCSTINALPKKKSACESGKACLEIPTGPTFTPPDCICKDDGSRCGSTFVDACNLQKNALYKCKNGAVPSMDKDCGTGTCSANVVKGTAEFRAAADDTCIDQCACKEANVPVCASVFDPVCNYGDKSLMACGNVGDVPTIKDACTLSCTKQAGPDVCTLDPCACSRVGDTCGRAFPANCGYLTDSLYTCAASRTLPVKKSDCQSSEICQTVPGGVDVCVANDICDCVGTGTVCTDRFPAKCAKPANSVVTCPVGTVTACPNGCAAAQCKAAGCNCIDNSDRCGASFSPACNLMPNALYMCVNGQAPVLKSDCGTQACVKSSGNAVCQDPCKCRGLSSVCGSAYPTSCSLLKDTLYNCTEIGVAPVVASACAAGCYASQPNASCKKECATTVTAATAQITKVIAAMTAMIPSNNITKVVYPPLIAVLNDVAANLTRAKDDLKALALIASTSGQTVESALQLLTTANAEFKSLNFSISMALNNSLPDLQASVQNVVTCAGISMSDCSGVLSLYNKIAADANTKATQTPANVTKDMTTQLANITSALANTLTTGNTTTLRATGQALGALIGKTSGNAVKYGDFSYSIIFMYDAYGQALKCKGLNETLFADKCGTDRMQGVLSDFIQFLQDNIGAIPFVGPLIITPLLVVLKAAVIDLQQGVATAVGGVASLLHGILQIVNIVSPGDQTNVVRDYIVRLVGLLDIPTECASGVSPCTGLIQIVRMLGQAVVNLISQIPVFGYMIGVTLNPILDGLLKALTAGTSSVITTSYNALSGALSVVEILPFFGNIAVPFRYLLDATKAVVDCMTKGASTTSHFEVEKGAVVEKIEIVEQPEKMLAEV